LHTHTPQVEFYFTDENLHRDARLMERLRHGLVPLELVCSFPRMKKLCPNKELIAQVASRSSFIYLSPDGKKVGRRDFTEQKGAALRAVEFSHLPSDATVESVRALVRDFGGAEGVELGPEGTPDGLQKALVHFADADHALEVGGVALRWR
jgi:hypothetical protein